MAYSFIIPTHNSREGKGHSIDQTLARLLAVCEDSEVICIDAGSQDSTPVFLSALASSDPRVRVLLRGQRIERSTARNLGAHLATGEVLVFLDDDCLVPTAGLIPAFDRAVERGFFGTGAVRHWVSGEEHGLTGLVRPRGPVDLSSFSFISHFGFVDHDLFRRVGGFDESYVGWGLEDLDLMLRLMIRSNEYVSLHGMSVQHLTHPISRRDLRSVSDNVARYLRSERQAGVHFDVRALLSGRIDDAVTKAGPGRVHAYYSRRAANVGSAS